MNSHTRSSKKVRSANGKGNWSATERRFGHSRLKGEMRRHTYYARKDLLERVREDAYGEQVGISELMNRILEGFFEEQDGEPKPHRK